MKIISTVSEIEIGTGPAEAAYILKNSKYLCFLDSSLYPNKYSRFSYLAWEPGLAVTSNGYINYFLNLEKGITIQSYQHPLSFLKNDIGSLLLEGLPADPNDNKNKPVKYFLDYENGKIIDAEEEKITGFPDFIGGFAGYFSYDLKNYIEKLPERVADDQGLPLMYLLYFNRLLAFRHLDSKWFFIRNYFLENSSENKSNNPGVLNFYKDNFREDNFIDGKTIKAGLFEKIKKEATDIKRIFQTGSHNSDFKNIMEGIIKKYSAGGIRRICLKPNMSRRNYIDKVKKVKEHIFQGDIYQVNYSQRFEADLPVEHMDLYYILRRKNPAPFSAYLKFPEFTIGSSSPERFLFLRNNRIETRPIKGTRPRGKNEREEEENRKELAKSEKDRAELNMIVDLERNDLGKFCYYGSVKVIEHAVIEEFARVFHSVSTVAGAVKCGTTISDIIKATFPGGSITGAPKIRAMEIIDELEPVARNIYTGALGYIGIDKTMDLNIVIRTFVIKGNKFYYNVGGGIVADSFPSSEYLETLDKGLALEESLKFFIKKNLKNLLKNKVY